ncbi:chemotaxis protein CheW [Spartinivicinus poritis]|uniref:Chemotaxis protein CheW n=1 Tax=Spartinivicinus poritis TaxID=2994640 RepID=A0ABT5U594_9GAMM|nr:chemotaxis protein CheW [Spartinivicinus sp. A2-2]MDE1461529.1 chemotaxis protein CheW [Spartinivicinus sp. A2-2]
MKPLEGSKPSANDTLEDYLSDLLHDNHGMTEPVPDKLLSTQQTQQNDGHSAKDVSSVTKEALTTQPQAPSSQQPKAVTATRQLPEVLLPQQVLTPPVEALQQTIAAPELDTVTDLQKLQKASLAELIIAKAQSAPPITAVEQGRPAWAEKPFECLLFNVAGLTLAVPLVCLGGVYLFNDSVTQVVGQPEWVLGLYKHHDQSLSVVDTAWWVMPERYKTQTIENYHYIISIDKTRWGIAVHDLAHAVRISPDAVKWRTKRTQRPWLAGIVIDEMCALLDIAKLAQLFDEQASLNRSSNTEATDSKDDGYVAKK